MASDEKPTFTRDQLKALANLSPEQIKTLGKVGKVASAGTTRRNVLGALAGAGIGGAASYSAMGSASADASTTDGDGNIGTPSDPVDVFAEGVDSNSVITGNLNTVRYASEYPSLQAAADDTPEGGTLILPAKSYDIASVGTISSSRGFTVKGTGWAEDSGTGYGTTLINTGADTVSGPIIEFTSSASERKASVEDLYIEHEGSADAIRFNNRTWAGTKRVGIQCNQSGAGGVEAANGSFFFHSQETWVNEFTSTGFNLTGTGSQHVIEDCHTVSNVAGAIGVHTQRPGTRVVRGQHNVAGGVGIQFDNPNASSLPGGTVRDVAAETGVAVELTGSDYWESVDIITPRWDLSGVTTGCRFDFAAYCTLQFPQVQKLGGGGDLVEFTTNHSINTVIGNYIAGRAPITNNGGARSMLKVPQALADGNIAAVTTTPDSVRVDSATDHNGLAITTVNNGTDWILSDGTTVTI